MKDQTICVQVDGKYFKWMASKNDPESKIIVHKKLSLLCSGGTIGEEYRPSRGIVLMGTAEAARNPKLFPIDSEDLTIRVFIGSQDAAANFDGMKEMSITLVLNVATGVSVMHNDSVRIMNSTWYISLKVFRFAMLKSRCWMNQTSKSFLYLRNVVISLKRYN